MFNRFMLAGAFHLPRENRLNEKLPQVRPVSLREFLTAAWKGRD